MLAMVSLLRTILKNFRQAIAHHEDRARNAQLSRPPEQIDSKVLIVIVVACVILSFLDYYGGSLDWEALQNLVGFFSEEAAQSVREFFRDREWGRLRRLGYWSGTTFIGYFLVPVLVIWLVLRERVRDYGLSFRRSTVPFGLTLGLFLIMVPFVLAVAFTESFQSTYPFYHHADRSRFDLIAWLFIYALQFFALEFFYRGFLIEGLRHRFGVYAILVSTIPYVMIHFGKPMAETLGSIIAGIVLGGIAYHYRSIWPAVVLHIAIAVSMDLFSLSAQGRLFSITP